MQNPPHQLRKDQDPDISRVILRLKHRLIVILLSDRSKKQEALITTFFQELAVIKELRKKKNIPETNITTIDLNEVFRIAYN